MSVRAGNAADTSAPRNLERIGEPNNETLHELTEERIKTNLGPLNKQINTLTQLLNRLIQENSAPRRRAPLLSRHKRDAHPVMKSEPPELCPQGKLGVRDLRLTVIEIMNIFTEFHTQKGIFGCLSLSFPLITCSNANFRTPIPCTTHTYTHTRTRTDERTQQLMALKASSS